VHQVNRETGGSVGNAAHLRGFSTKNGSKRTSQRM